MTLDYIPQGPSFLTDSDSEQSYTPSGEEAYRQKMLSWRSAAKEEALGTYRENSELKSIPKYINSLSGSYWNPRRAKYKSPFFDNRLNKARIDSLAALTDTRPAIDIKTGVPAYKVHGEMAHGILRHEWMTQGMDLSLVMATDICQLQGTSFWKLGAGSPGLLNAIPCGIENVLPIQPGFHIQDSTAVLYRTWKPLLKLKRKYPFTSGGLEKQSGSIDSQFQSGNVAYQRPNYVDEYVWNGLSPAMQRALGTRGEPDKAVQNFFRSIETEEYFVDDDSINDSRKRVLMRHPYLPTSAHNWWYWVEPGQKLYPRKRLIVFAGDIILHDGPAPFWHGLYPFACMRLNPVPWSFWGLSKYRDLLPVNSAINEIIAAMLDMVKRALNPQAISKTGAVNAAAWGQFFSDMPGTKLLMGPNANPAADIRYMSPPDIPAYVLNLLVMVLIPEFDRLAGAIDAGMLGKKKQIPGGETIEQMKDLQNTGTRLEGRFIESFLKDSGLQSMSNIFQFYTMSQRLKILGEDGITKDDFDSIPDSTVPDEVLPREDFWKQFSLSVTPGSIHTGAKDREKTIAMTMQRMGQLSLRELWRRMEVKNADEQWKEIQEEHQAGMGISKGRQPRSAGEKKGQG